MTMTTGFRQLPTDPDFARRSAAYLVRQGCGRAAVYDVLVDQLNVDPRIADQILAGAIAT